jgi:hypothetical protein
MEKRQIYVGSKTGSGTFRKSDPAVKIFEILGYGFKANSFGSTAKLVHGGGF